MSDLKEDTKRKFVSFISYTTRGPEMNVIMPFVDKYVGVMRNIVWEYIPIFFDRMFIPDGHEHLGTYLASALQRSDFATIFLSPDYMESFWCGTELGGSLILNEIGQPKVKILPICWKKNQSAWKIESIGIKYVDVSPEIEQGNWGEALEKAVRATLEFIRSYYGVEFDRRFVDEYFRGMIDWHGEPHSPRLERYKVRLEGSGQQAFIVDTLEGLKLAACELIDAAAPEGVDFNIRISPLESKS
jgi:hypothetical protein